ncbi:TadE family type IV pilus minor pilin [Arthrobacter koreensis]|uniref:TadE family type IV pilus minor pilin n=1 Tax=Arthrobacter koreensis TaxID=199136 RepID=UPI002DB58F7F|nr:TadE family type IV pilus minor pilin [Arthrobacter koreensis]MEB7506028.1 pilus assembly protein TadE [Arthrobacter koreensis]
MKPVHSPHAEQGAVTAELAVAMPAAAILLAALLTGAAAGLTQLRLEEAAGAAARLVMRGDTSEAAGAVARLAGDGAGMEVSESGDWVHVRVESALRAPLLDLLPVTLVAEASAPREEK